MTYGVGDLPLGDGNAEFQSKLSMATLVDKAKAGSCGSTCRAATALILLRQNKADADAKTLLDDFSDGLRVTGRTVGRSPFPIQQHCYNIWHRHRSHFD